MHDLLHDLAMFLARDFYCRIEEHGKTEDVTALTRHMSYESLSHLIAENFASISKAESLRTFFPGNTRFHFNDMDGVACILISKLKYLRVLSFSSHTKLDVLPDSISELTYLRYLDLSRTSITTLPESLCDLYNLKTLILYKCLLLTMLPSGMHKLVNLRHLDIWNTFLKEMSGGMSKLKQFHILSYFTVGKHENNGIQELGGLLNLHGTFAIKKLENVADVKQAESATIIDKKHIDRLVLQWSSDTQTKRDILDNLQPHNSLKILAIEGYKGTIFPNWVGHRSNSNMTRVTLESCNNCCKLPSLGQLPFLESLRISRFGQLKSIGMEFYNNEGDIVSFPSLKTLEFWSMPYWEVWHLSESEVFPQLSKLQIDNFPMLKGDMLGHVFLRIISSLSNASKVLKLDISEEYEGRSQEMSLKGNTLSIKGCASVVQLLVVSAMSNNHLCCLQEIHISRCWSVLCFPGNCLSKSLKKLTIRSCSNLEFPQQQQQKNDLVELRIENSCDSLISLSLDAFPSIKILEIRRCLNLESISMSEPSHDALHCLTIYYCQKLVSFLEEGLAAPNLTHLNLSRCPKLESLPSDMNTLLLNLHSLNMEGCSKICKLQERGLPLKLKELGVGGCEQQLRGLLSMANLYSLMELTILGSSDVRSYPEVGSLPHLPSLTTLTLAYFLNLETLECNCKNPLFATLFLKPRFWLKRL
ncbi:hypothetical protein PIB30_024350 [Stylosanthes scabra]|uniref:R13L1/DRL21-like LRR repeat region domain-containing protein n=1 Tax=Stylosanthes scabra TaxID=79078 RepID=A0ABU6Q9C2_9FABA|nr:hypothetical protein [Stylosanthes scabra]